MASDPDSPMTVCFDLDGTLCTNTYGAYDEAEPFPWAIERVNALADAGHKIIVFTARGTATGLDWRQTTRAQLDRWGVRYDDLQLGKPSAAVYVDDRAVHTTAWREGDAWAVPGFGVPAPEGRREPLPEPLALQRTTVVETGRTYAGRPFLADEHIERARARAQGAALDEVPAPAHIRAALDDVLSRPRANAADVVFSITLAGPVDAGFLDVAGERVHAPLVTLRSLSQAAQGLRPLLDPAGGPLALHVPASGLGGRLAAVVDGELLLAPTRAPAAPLSAWLEQYAGEAGLALSSEPLAGEHLAPADEVFEAVAPFGLVRVTRVGQQAVPAAGAARDTLAAVLSAQVGVDADAQLAEALGL